LRAALRVDSHADAFSTDIHIQTLVRLRFADAMENVKLVVRFVRAFILAEPDIAIDAREVSSGLAAGLKVRVELQQERLERLEQAAKSSHHVPIVAFPVLIEPSFVVVLRELAKEF